MVCKPAHPHRMAHSARCQCQQIHSEAATFNGHPKSQSVTSVAARYLLHIQDSHSQQHTQKSNQIQLGNCKLAFSNAMANKVTSNKQACS